MRAWLAAATICSLGLPSPATADDATTVVELRLQVESLAQSLDERRTSTNDELAALRAERAELQRQVRLAKVRNRTLVRLEQQDAEADEARRAAADEWHAPARAAVALARAHVNAGLPFAVPTRLETLDRIDADLSAAQPDVARAMQRLWRFVEEEAAMTREVTLAQLPMTFADGPRMCDVLRIGMALLYVRTAEGELGWAVHQGDEWRIATLDDPLATRIVGVLFDAAQDNEIFGPAELLLPTEIASGVGDVE